MICQDIINSKGIDSKYAKDCFIRYILDESPPEASWERALSLSADPNLREVIIDAGIGRLRVTPAETDFRPTVSQTIAAPPLAAPNQLRDARLSVCQTCSKYDNRCTVAGCGCAGQGTPSALFSKCPMGLWPINT